MIGATWWLKSVSVRINGPHTTFADQLASVGRSQTLSLSLIIITPAKQTSGAREPQRCDAFDSPSSPFLLFQPNFRLAERKLVHSLAGSFRCIIAAIDKAPSALPKRVGRRPPDGAVQSTDRLQLARLGTVSSSIISFRTQSQAS